MRRNDAEHELADAPDEGADQPRGRTMSRMSRSFDIAKGFKNTANDLTFNGGSANDDGVSNPKRTEQPTEASNFKLGKSFSEPGAISSGIVKTPSIAATTPSKEAKPTVLVMDIRLEPENLDSDSAARELLPNSLILENITRAKSLGTGAYGEVYALKVVRCGDSVKQRLTELSKSPELPEDYRVALRVLTWSRKQCECHSCTRSNRLRQAQRLPRCLIFPPAHVPQCEATETFSNEIISLHRYIGVSGIQQIIGYEISEDNLSGRLASTYTVAHSCDSVILAVQTESALSSPVLTARLEGKTLPAALRNYPGHVSFASKNPSQLTVSYAIHR